MATNGGGTGKHQQGEAEDETTGPLRQLPPLIDVDCNLWHDELHSFARQHGSSNDDDDSNNDGDADDTTQLRRWGRTVFDLLRLDAVRESNIVAMVSPSSTLTDAKRGLAFLRQPYYQQDDDKNNAGNDAAGGPPPPLLPLIRTTVGVHPYHVSDAELEGATLEEHVDEMRSLILQNPTAYCAAVGECGLDRTEGFPDIQLQLPWFEAQVKLASELKLPLFIHERGAFQETVDILQRHNCSVPVLIHCFTGTVEECRAYVSAGYSISVSGYICKPGSEQVRECLEQGIIPLDRLMVETDAPYMGFASCRAAFCDKNSDYVKSLNSKKRKRLQTSTYPNLPSSLPAVMERVLLHLNRGRQEQGEEGALLLTMDELAKATTTRNADAFFRFGLLDDDNDNQE